LGVNAGAQYLIIDQLSIAPSYSYYFPTEESGLEYNLNVINVDARYYLTTGEFQPYALLGFTSITSEVTADDGEFSFSVEETAGGLNAGIGANYFLGDSFFANCSTCVAKHDRSRRCVLPMRCKPRMYCWANLPNYSSDW